MLLVVATACAGREQPPEFDAQLADGTPIALPVAGEFPRLGIRWTYQVTHAGFPADAAIAPRIAYHLTHRDRVGHPWAGWWLYAGERGVEFTGATIESNNVFFHPPRLGIFRELEWAAWPIATPGQTGKSQSELVLGDGWGDRKGERVAKTREDVGPREIEVPAGRFADTWHTRGTAPGWKGAFWWASRVGFVRMLFEADDGRSLDLRLLDVRDFAR